MPERMTITHRDDGRFVTTVQLHGKRRFVYGASEREVRQKATELLKQTRRSGVLPSPGKRTVHDLLETWLDAVRPVLKPRTVANYVTTAERYIEPAIGHIALSRLQPTDIQALYNTLASRGLKRAPAYTHAVLHRACRLGVLWGWLGQNPCDRLLPPRYQAPRKEVWTAEQTARFLAETREHRHGPLWSFLVYTGARVGEATALRWEDVQDDSVRIRRAVHRIGGVWVESAPKTHAGVRTVSIPSELVLSLQRESARQAERRLRLGGDWQDNRLVFSNDTGGVLHPSMVAHSLQVVCDSLGLPRLTPHGLRHLSASLLLGQNISLPSVSKRLGHAHPGITARIYSHVTKTDHHAADALQSLLGEANSVDHAGGSRL